MNVSVFSLFFYMGDVKVKFSIVDENKIYVATSERKPVQAVGDGTG